MTADISRVTYDEAQQYRLVVGQQGRVLLDTDLTDGQRLLGEEQRRAALDFVGPSGAPGGGYKVTVPAKADPKRPPFDFDVAAGVIYVGGLRVELLAPITYAEQPDWLNPSRLPGQPVRECIVLHLREQEVGAVEDPELREVALGGPDSSQRTRLLQQVERYGVSGTDCGGAFAEVVNNWWGAQGLNFDAATMRLNPTARLQVSFKAPTTPPDRCQPEASGGYLGADNQLIRVQIAAPDRLVWGFDNASFLYRVEVVDKSTLRLRNRPVDAAHQPRAPQTVEILRATAKLPNSDTVAGPGTHAADGAFVAAPTGELRRLTANYDPDSQTVKLDSPLTGYSTGDNLPPLFLRVWEADLPIALEPRPMFDGDLGATGLRVTGSGGPFTPGAYWTFAARPFTPGLIDPGRYLAAPQPPDGPRCWACALAVLDWSKEDTQGGPTDCRLKFPLARPGIHVTGVFSFSLDVHGNRDKRYPLGNDATVRSDHLEGGIDVECDAEVDQATISRPTCFVTVEMPFPLSTDVTIPPPDSTYQPLVLRGSLSTAGRTISWRPFEATRRFINQLPGLKPASDPEILARLTLKGNFIWARDNPQAYLDGKPSGFRLSDGNTTDIHLPSGGGLPGSDFEMWFWLTTSHV
jgi:hypothetical protein